MTLVSGTKLGPYEVVSALGTGGMGEVYRARDTRLGRDVAIKVLPPQFSNDAVRKHRFEREAKTISGLNHPNICVLHGRRSRRASSGGRCRPNRWSSSGGRLRTRSTERTERESFIAT